MESLILLSEIRNASDSSAGRSLAAKAKRLHNATLVSIKAEKPSHTYTDALHHRSPVPYFASFGRSKHSRAGFACKA